MRLLVIGAGMMGSAAAYDMARSPGIESVTLLDADGKRATAAVRRIARLTGAKNVRAVRADAAVPSAMLRAIRGHDAVLSCVPYHFNHDLARVALEAGCHFADLGGNNTVVRRELALGKRAEKAGLAIAPDCGLSPGLASILAGELMRRVGGRADALKIYVGGLPVNPEPPFGYQLVFSPEGLINEYVEPCRILRRKKITEIEPLTELEIFHMRGFAPLEAFHTSGGTSTLAETFAGKVGECFEKTLRYPGHFAMVRALYDLGLFSSAPVRIDGDHIVPRRLTTRLFEEKFAGHDPDLVIMRVEAHTPDRVLAFRLVDYCDPATGMTAMMRTTAWPASIVMQMIASEQIAKRGAILQETDVPFAPFSEALEQRGIEIHFGESRH